MNKLQEPYNLKHNRWNVWIACKFTQSGYRWGPRCNFSVHYPTVDFLRVSVMIFYCDMFAPFSVPLHHSVLFSWCNRFYLIAKNIVYTYILWFFPYECYDALSLGSYCLFSQRNRLKVTSDVAEMCITTLFVHARKRAIIHWFLKYYFCSLQSLHMDVWIFLWI